jgi:hypothetical protein
MDHEIENMMGLDKTQKLYVGPGCQIFLCKTYQKRGENISNDNKTYQKALNIPNARTIFQMTIKYTKHFPFQGAKVPKLGFLV